MADENTGLKGFFRSLFGGSGGPGEPAEEPEEKVEQEKQETPPPAPRLESYGRLSPMKDSLLQLWDQWTGGALPPGLSLTDGLDLAVLHLDADQLQREAMRIEAQLEQAAKKRLNDIENAKSKEITALNAECKVYVARDRMIAWLFIFPPFGEEGTLSMDSIGKALQENNVTSGINAELIIQVFQDKPYYKLIPIAVGTPPVQGQNGTVTEHFSREQALEVKVDDAGVADYKYTNYVRQVTKDEVICDITLPVPGQPGLRIDGTVVEPRPVKAAKVPKGKNTMVTEDGLRLVSTMDGHLEFSNQTFQVRAVLDVPGDVDYQTGNIEFIGDVHIAGDVRENFSVIASGSITVDGLVEAATIDAGGDLLITRGVVGDNRALVRSKGCVRVKYLENCVVYAGRGVFADCIMNSQIFSDSVVEVCTGRGSIIGGAVTAAERIKAKMLGAESGRRTEVTLGVLPYVQNELQNIQEDLAANRQEKVELDKQLSYLERQQGLEGSDPRFAKARMRKSVLEMKEQQLLKRQEKLEPLIPDISKCRVECEAIYPNTTITVQETVWTARETKKRCAVVYDAQERAFNEVY